MEPPEIQLVLPGTLHRSSNFDWNVWHPIREAAGISDDFSDVEQPFPGAEQALLDSVPAPLGSCLSQALAKLNSALLKFLKNAQRVFIQILESLNLAFRNAVFVINSLDERSHVTKRRVPS